MHLTIEYLFATWELLARLAPWLLFGFFLAGVISMYLRRSTVVRILGKPGIGSIVRATLVGVPMPLCSCGVIPVAAAIREKGAGRGATAAFLASTPETGVDSFFGTWGLMGPFMAVVRVVVAFVNGILAGLFVTLATRGEKDEYAAQGTAENERDERRSFGDALRYAFISMPSDMAESLIVGILLAGAVSAFIPADFVTGAGVSGIGAYVIVTLIAIPLYVCSVGSIPLAVAMIHAGFSPGAALVFLIAGPATNVATIVTMRRYLGTRAVVAYVLSIVVTAWGAGFVVDMGLGRSAVLASMPHVMEKSGLLGGIAAVVLAILILHGWLTRHFPPLLKRAARARAGEACACEGHKTHGDTSSHGSDRADKHACSCGSHEGGAGEECCGSEKSGKSCSCNDKAHESGADDEGSCGCGRG